MKNSQEEYQKYQKEKTYAKYELSCNRWAIDLSWINSTFKWICLSSERAPSKADAKGDILACDPKDKSKQAGCETLQQFAQRRRGGASPINLDFTGLQNNGVYSLVDFS